MPEIGPVEYIAVAFPGNKFKGDIIPALKELVEAGTIRVIDLAFVVKDPEGNIAAMEIEEVDSDLGQAFATLQAEVGDLVNEADLKEIGAALEPNSSAAILVWEDTWAAKFTNALRDAGGILIDRQTVPHEVLTTAMEWSAQSKSA
jgi:hypothetical protein